MWSRLKVLMEFWKRKVPCGWKAREASLGEARLNLHLWGWVNKLRAGRRRSSVVCWGLGCLCNGFQTSEDFRITWEAYLRHTPGDLWNWLKKKDLLPLILGGHFEKHSWTSVCASPNTLLSRGWGLWLLHLCTSAANPGPETSWDLTDIY